MRKLLEMLTRMAVRLPMRTPMSARLPVGVSVSMPMWMTKEMRLPMWMSPRLLPVVLCGAFACAGGIFMMVAAEVAIAQESPVAGDPEEVVEPGAAIEPHAAIEPVAATGGILDILYLRSFTLEESYAYTFTREQPDITAGYLIVLEVKPELVLPRDVDVPVLFAGDTPVHLTNTGYPSGRVIVIVPSWIDPATVPFYLGSMGLPERITRARGAAELVAAIAEGARPFEDERIASARASGGEAARFADSVALFRAVADLIDVYAPDEAELAANYRTRLVTE